MSPQDPRKQISEQGWYRQFVFEEHGVRGQLVRLTGAWQAMHAGRDYPAVLRRMLGEFVAFGTMIGGQLKIPGRLTVQLQGGGPLGLLLVDVFAHGDDLGVRAYARTRASLVERTLAECFGDGRLAVTLFPDAAELPYQSLVPLDGDTISEICSRFVEQSEQQATVLWLAASDAAAGGLFLQRLPQSAADDDDDWRRLCLLAATARAHELLELPVTQLLPRLFPEDDIRLFDPRPLHYHCLDARPQIAATLVAMGRAELDTLLAEQGEIVVHDEVCNRDYRFTGADVEALFSPSARAP